MRRAIELAWESAAAGSFGIGAVVTAADGRVLSTGRNRIVERDPGDDVLAGTSLAHAEMNALAKLPWRVHDADRPTLWTTLQPCVQCLGAIRLSPVVRVEVLAPDPIFRGVESIRHATEFLGRNWPEVVERAVDEWSVLGLLFQAHLAAWWGGSSTSEAWEAALPSVVRLAERCAADHTLVSAAERHDPVRDVAASLWDDLRTCVPEVARLAADRPPV